MVKYFVNYKKVKKESKNMEKINLQEECHGHEKNPICLKCDKFNLKSFNFKVDCPQNKEMLDYKLSTLLNNNKQKNKKTNILLQKISKKITKVGKSKFNKFKDFYYDFNYGVRFFTKKKSLLVKIFNLDTGNKIFEVNTFAGQIYSPPQKFYVKWGIEVYENNKLYFKHNMDLRNQEVLIKSNSNCLGDNIAYIEAVSTFQEKHQCNLTLLCKHPVSKIFEINYPNIKFINKKQIKKYYATYQIICGNNQSQFKTIVYDRIISLDKVCDYILQVKHKQIRKLKTTENIDFGGKYVVYSERASSKMKEWNNPKELKKTIKYIQDLGFKVINLDIKPYNKQIENVIYLNDKPYSLQDKINIISNATFFLGLPSGLSWLAWACKIPAIVFGSFCLPICEFENPYRIINTDFCFGCWNYHNSFSCSYDDKERFAICNKSITSQQIQLTIDKLLKDKNLL